MQDLLFRSARPSDIDALVALENAVESALPSREMFATDGREFYVPIVAGAGHILLAEDAEGGLAGVSVIRFPAADEEENLGRELELPKADLSRVRHLESVFVRCDCQGRKLAERLIRENMRLTEASGRTLSCATVWPLNLPSLRLHLALGLYVRAFAFKYGGKARFVLGNAVAVSPDAPVFVPCGEFSAHQALLAQGYAGVALHRRADGHGEVEYRKLRA